LSLGGANETVLVRVLRLKTGKCLRLELSLGQRLRLRECLVDHLLGTGTTPSTLTATRSLKLSKDLISFGLSNAAVVVRIKRLEHADRTLLHLRARKVVLPLSPSLS